MRRRSEAEAVLEKCLHSDRPTLAAAASVLHDLSAQGWKVRGGPGCGVQVRPPSVSPDPTVEKERIRRQELLRRDEQLAAPSVQRFVSEMERPRLFAGRFVSIFSLMRDGQEFRDKIEGALAEADPAVALSRIIDPYVQVVFDAAEHCEHTGLRLGDIWRYFRHTWVNQYTSTPGRTMLLLVRDRAAPFHPVIGIAALGSPIVQIKERDNWIGWQSADFVADLARAPSARRARWASARLDRSLQELYLDDLIEDGLYWPALWAEPTPEAIARLRKEAEARRDDHRRFVQRREFKRDLDPDDAAGWRKRAESDLFRSKRCLALADLLDAKAALDPFLSPKPSRDGLVTALGDRRASRALADLVRRAKAESVGTEMADLTVCGAIAPYNAILGGKLVSMLAASPTVVRAYKRRYGDYVSVIASAMAGRPVRRRNNLVFVGTTSLYGSGSSQYNRLRLPAGVLEADEPTEFRPLGRSRSFGTSQFSARSVSLLVQLSEQTRSGVRVNSIFGEGVNPKLRKVRDGLDLLGWPSETLLQHGRERIVYGVSLVTNLRDYLLGLDPKPQYRFRPALHDDVDRISGWWLERWVQPRVHSDAVLEAVGSHRVDRPVRHGARVPIVKQPMRHGSVPPDSPREKEHL